jgi:TonB-dependent SusC/RagA subfamily outer membrane receptor
MEQTTATSEPSQKAKGSTVLRLLLFLLFPMSSGLVGQENGSQQPTAVATEKIYLHLDKSYYAAGEDIWFKAYLMNGMTNASTAPSDIVYVDLIGPNGQSIAKRTFKTSNGSVAGDFKLSQTSISGQYTIRGYTNYMRNFGESNYFSKAIFVNSLSAAANGTNTAQTKDSTNIDVQFFPEGGHLIAGFLNPVGFKAIDDQGNSIAITGKLVDDTGKRIKEFSSTHLGMGLFYFIPKPGRTYKAIVSYRNQEKNFSLPKALNSGVLMTVSNQPKHYKIELRGTTDLKMKDFRLIGKQLRGTVFKLIVNANKQEHTTIVKIAKDILEEGILELTLLNQEKKPIAERLLFHEGRSNSPLSKITTSKTSYGQRELAAMEVEIEVAHSKEITADMSLSVTNVVVNPAAVHTTDIKTHLLLSSVLIGKIDQPGYYFYSRAIDRQKNLDILMRTQGWRQYALDEQLVKEDKYFLPETGITLSGKVVDAMNTTEPLTGSVSLTANSITEMIQDIAKTTEDGAFSFNNLNFADTTTVLLSANVYYPNKKRNPTLNYKIIFDSIPSPPILGARNVAGPLAISASNSPSKTMEKFTTGYEKAQQTTLSFLYTDKTIQLDEAIIAVKKEKKLDKYAIKRKVVPYKTPSQTVDFEGFTEMGFTNLLDALRGRVPGLSVRGGGVYLRAASSLGVGNAEETGSALILLDGAPVGSDILEQMLPTNVDFIDVLKGPRAAIYGSRAANGVIAVYTKNGEESLEKAKRIGGSLNFKHPGYVYARKFYKPKYGSGTPENKEVDSRTTLHWQPYIQLNNEGKTSISFYSGDVLGDYQVTLEGITTEGVPVKSTTTFSVE